MNIAIVAVGRLKAGPERDLVERYIDRAAAAGRRAGLAVRVREVPESRAGTANQRRREEANAIAAAAPADARVVVLDERGKALGSAGFAQLLGRWRDDGIGTAMIAVGGPDGHGAAIRESAAVSIAFGAMTWPHQLVRAMAAEQVYRAVTILTGHPYHRA